MIAAPIAAAGMVMGAIAYIDQRADATAHEQAVKRWETALNQKVFEFKDASGAVFPVEAPDYKMAADGFERFKKRSPDATPPPSGYVIQSDTGPWSEFPRKATNVFDDLAPTPPKTFAQYFVIPLLTLAFAMVAYAAIRAIGWVIAGFMRNPEGAN